MRLASSLSRFARYTKIDLLLHQLASSSYSPHDLCTAVRQMADLKAADNETLMHYLVRLIDRKYTHLTELPSDFPSLQQAARESIKQTLADLVALNNAVELVKPEFEAQTSPGDPFASMMRDFYTKAHEQLQATREDLNRIQDEYKGLLKYFGEAETTDFQDFMGNLVFLCTIFQKACDDNARKEQLILEAAKNAERKRRTVRHAESNDRSIAHSLTRSARQMERKKGAGGASGPQNPLAGPQGQDVLDSLIGSMRSGRAFGRRDSELAFNAELRSSSSQSLSRRIFIGTTKEREPATATTTAAAASATDL